MPPNLFILLTLIYNKDKDAKKVVEKGVIANISFMFNVKNILHSGYKP